MLYNELGPFSGIETLLNRDIAVNTNYNVDFKNYKFLLIEVSMSNAGSVQFVALYIPGALSGIAWPFNQHVGGADNRYEFSGTITIYPTYVKFTALNTGAGTGATAKRCVITGVA